MQCSVNLSRGLLSDSRSRINNEQWIMEREKRAFLKELKNNIQIATLNIKSPKILKCSKTSEVFRKDGNTLFLQKGHSAATHRQIFNYYCQSVITAPNSSDHLAFAYGNRSAFLLHIKKYEDCIKDCNRALKINSTDIFKIKMLCRKAECLKKLRLPEFQGVLEEAESCVDKIDDEHQKKKLVEAIVKVKTFSISKNSDAKNKNVDRIELDEILDGIKIEYNQKYGRHLIATKDYKPGDIILIENLFATTISQEVFYTNCHYCMKICWSGVPCKHCVSAIFCSEDCRHKAWKLFHDVECPLFSFLKLPDQMWLMCDTVVRAILIGVRQAGSIAQLRANLKSIDQSDADESSKGFIKDGEYTKSRIESIYVLNSDQTPDYILKSMASCASMTVTGIAHYSKLFTNIDLKDVNKLTQHKDFIFLGSLIIKLMVIKGVNDCSFAPKQMYTCEKSNSLSQCRQGKCCVRGSCFSPISSLVSHSCFPNAARCFSEDRKVITYAVLPIKKNTQIFNSYSCEFDDNPIAERKLILQKYEIVCDCQACTESWPPILHLSQELLDKYNYDISSALENKIYNDCSHIFDKLNKMKINFKKKDIETLSKAIAQASKLKQPSKLMCFLAESMKRVFSHVYGLKLQVPSFGRCI